MFFAMLNKKHFCIFSDLLVSKCNCGKKSSETGAVIVEFFLGLLILTVFLIFFFDIGQRVGQLSWVNQVSYIVSYLGSESNLEKREYIQRSLIDNASEDYNNNNSNTSSLIDAQNNFWKMKSYYNSTLASSERLDEKPTELTKIQGAVDGLWNPVVASDTKAEFILYRSNNLNSIISDSYKEPANVIIKSHYSVKSLKYDWCGRICNNNCPSFNESGYVVNQEGQIVPSFSSCDNFN